MKLANISPVLKHMNLPNMITTFGLVFGIIAAYFLTRQDLRMAIIMLFFAGVMDLIDGFVASKLKQVSEFGKHLDTLVDFFTCVIMPLWMVFYLLDYTHVVFVALIFYCICGLWRLANYNLVGGGEHFRGLPVPSAMAIVTVVTWFVVMHSWPMLVVIIMFIVLGMLMVSGFQLVKYGLWQKAFGVCGLLFFLYVVIWG